MKRKRGPVFVCLLILFCGVILASFRVGALRNEKKILETYSRSQEKTVADVVSAAGREDSFADRAAALLQKSLETSASVYGCISRDGNLIFLRDESTSRTVNGTPFEREFSRLDGSDPFSPEVKNTFRAVAKNGEVCLVSMQHLSLGGHDFGVGIVSRQSYVLRRYGVDESERNLLILILLPELALLFSCCFLLNRLGAVQRRAVQLSEEERDDRFYIEELTENLKKYRDIRPRQSLCPKDVVSTVIGSLTEQQKHSAGKLTLRVPSDGRDIMGKVMELISERNTGNCLACLEDENTGLILLLNTTEPEAREWKDFLQNNLQQQAGTGYEITLEPLSGKGK